MSPFYPLNGQTLPKSSTDSILWSLKELLFPKFQRKGEEETGHFHKYISTNPTVTLTWIQKGSTVVNTYHFVDRAVEWVLLSKDEEDDEGHVHVVGVSVLHMVEDL